MDGGFETLAAILFFFPPTAVIFMACVIKLFALLNESSVTWSKAFGWSLIVSLVLFFGAMAYSMLSQWQTS